MPRTPQITIAVDNRRAAEVAPFDFIVALGSEREEEARAARMLPWLSNSSRGGAATATAENPPTFFEDDFIAFLSGSLAPGGFVFLECRTGGLDLRHKPQVFQSLRAQLQSIGISPIEIYCVTTAPGLILMIAARSSVEAAKQIASRAANRSKITNAHTYIELESTVELTWTAARGDLHEPKLNERTDIAGRLLSLAKRVRGAVPNRSQSRRS